MSYPRMNLKDRLLLNTTLGMAVIFLAFTFAAWQAWPPLAMYVGMLGALIASSTIIRKNLVLPVSRLADLTRRFSDGEPRLGGDSRPNDELETLIRGVDAMSGRIETLTLRLKEAEEQNHHLLEGLDAIIWKADLDTLAFTFISRHAEAALGYPIEQWLDEPGCWKKVIHPDDFENCRESLRKAARGQGAEECELRALTADGSMVWFHNRCRAVRDEQGNALGIFGVMVDISARKFLETRMLHLATHDPLTGLPNRTLLVDRLEQAMAHARRSKSFAALMFIDLDRFKIINDSLGHAAGDEVLKSVSGRLRQSLRGTDTVARLGGDEFAVVLDSVTQEHDIAEVAQKILHSVSQPLLIDGHELKVGCSIGISLYPRDGEEQRLLLKNADSALYCVKAQGKNGFRFYTEEMNPRALEHMELESALHHALEKEQLLLHYQPQFALRSNGIAGVEALIRWQKPDVGLVPPAEFIGLAEETGLILPIGAWVLRTACRQNKAWQDAGLPHFRIAVNLSALQFMQQDIVTTVRHALDETGLAPEYLELEVTESVLMQDAQTVIGRMHQLKQLGVKLAIDDFGTGYSSLSYIKQFPIDTLKIDRSFIRDIIKDPDDAAIVSAIISMAHNLKIRVLAEGVETQEQQDFLRAQRCDEIQGYHFSKPLPAEQLIAILEAPQKPASAPDDQVAPALLLVDDEENILNALASSLRRQGYRILKASSAKEAFALLARNTVGVIVSDQRMPEMSGVDFLRRAKQLHPDAVRVVLTGYTDLKTVIEAINEGAVYKFLAKPWENEPLRALIAEAFLCYEMKQENAMGAANVQPPAPARMGVAA
ncbi:MAG: EAL domain-containing protein [Sulfuricella sp.]|nr:EAL domain-containing protein [Sulfuricella sp.]